LRKCPLCVPFFRNTDFLVFVMCGQIVLNDVFSCCFKMGIPIRHAERFVSDHFFGVLECSACHDDVGAVCVSVVMEVEVLDAQRLAYALPS